MKRDIFLMSVLAVIGVVPAHADDVLPKHLDFGRYEAILKQSPFAVASAPLPAASAPSWSKDLFVANAAHTHEIDLVTVMSLSDKNMKEYLSTEGPNKNGYGIANIEWCDTLGETKVTISKSGQFATLGFNEALLEQQTNPTALVPMPAPMVNAGPGFKQVPRPIQAYPTPHIRGIIPRNPGNTSGIPSQPMTPPLKPPPLPQSQ
jgi:hypothetical protein